MFRFSDAMVEKDYPYFVVGSPEKEKTMYYADRQFA